MLSIFVTNSDLIRYISKEGIVNISRYEALLVTYTLEIQRYLVKHGATVSDAQDIVQDVLVKLIQADIILSPDKLRPWLYRVALSRFYDLYRRKKRYQALLNEQFYLLYGNQEYVDESSAFLLHEAIKKLDDYQLALIVLYYEQHKSIKELSSIYQISEAKVKTDLYRVRQKLKAEMEQVDGRN